MDLQEECERITEALKEGIPHLPAAYLLEEYNQLNLMWQDLKMTSEIEAELERARTKTITANEVIKLNEVIMTLNEITALKSVLPEFKESIIRTIDNAKKHIDFNSNRAYHLHIEHDFEPNSTVAELWIKNWEEKLAGIKTDIDFTPYWGILETSQWEEVDEIFGEIMVGENEVLLDLAYAFKLNSYQMFYNTLEELNLFKPDNKTLPKGMKISIGEHDSHLFEFEVK